MPPGMHVVQSTTDPQPSLCFFAAAGAAADDDGDAAAAGDDGAGLRGAKGAAAARPGLRMQGHTRRRRQARARDEPAAASLEAGARVKRLRSARRQLQPPSSDMLLHAMADRQPWTPLCFPAEPN